MLSVTETLSDQLSAARPLMPTVERPESGFPKTWTGESHPEGQCQSGSIDGRHVACGVSLALDGPSRPKPILIGSIKSNLGHSEAASGISSIINSTLMLENGLIPATVGIRKLNPKIRLKEWNVDVVTELRPFPSLARRRVGVNSFGYGGANAHVVIESAPAKLRSGSVTASPVYQRSKVANLATWPGFGSFQLPDLVARLGQRCTHFKNRGFLVFREKGLRENLTKQTLHLGRGQTAPLDYAFVFTGQGAQWPQMGKKLLDEFTILPVAISKMDSVLAALSHPPSWTIAGALRQPKETSQIGAVTHSQPLYTTVQIGLVKLLSSWGINPRAVVGHSSGEMTAAFASAKITLAKAIITAYYRRYAVGVLTHGGKYQSLVANAIPKLDVSPSMVSDATLYSSVTGYSHHGPFDAAYWRANLESHVLFVDALSELARGGKYTLIELGPHSALELPIKQTRVHLKLEEASLSYFATLRRGKDSVDKVLDLVGSLWLSGHNVV
ncbi:Beta-ketoacyl synthase, partial [Metarhizium hybridum]